MTRIDPAVNPWTDRLDALLARNDLASLLTRKASPIRGLNSCPAETAPQLLKQHLETIYIASDEEVALVRQVLGIAHAHAMQFYSTPKRFAEDVHRRDLRLSTNPVTRMLTSEAGWGKSETALAITRLFSGATEFEVGHSLPPQRVLGIVRLSVESSTTRAGLLNALTRELGFPEDFGGRNSTDLDQIRRQAHRAGLMALFVDELQFLTRTSTAIALTTKLLHFLRSIGVPIVFIGNYSLGHKLIATPQEDQHRFLTEPLVMLPDAHDSRGFSAFIAAYVEAVGGCLHLDPDSDAKMLHWYTGGNRRLVRDLIIQAYAEVRRTAAARGSAHVTMNDLAVAYASQQFATKRAEVEICRKQLVQNRSLRKDLWCPFELTTAQNRHRSAMAKALQRGEIQFAELRASATPTELAGMEAMQKIFNVTEPGLEVPPKPRRQKKPKATVEDLLATRPDYYEK